jgi:predicted nucleotide-binding protein
MDAAIARLETRLQELRELAIDSISSATDQRVQAVQARINSTLAQIYGADSYEYARLLPAADLDLTPYTVDFIGGGSPTPVNEVREGLDRGRERSISLLQAEVDSLREALQHRPKTSGGDTPKEQLSTPSKDVFIVHGHDGPAKTEVARLIERAGLKAIILHEQPNAGATIIEKFEAHGSAAGFAVVVLTPDDMGGPSADKLQPRARQNVIGEMFWFAGKLGRKRVCALRKGNIEIPSDFSGVAYTEMDDRGAWKAELLRELAAAGYAVDWANALR